MKLKYLLFFILPGLIWIVGDGTYSGVQGGIDLTILPINLISCIIHLVVLKYSPVSTLLEYFTLVYGVFVVFISSQYDFNDVCRKFLSFLKSVFTNPYITLVFVCILGSSVYILLNAEERTVNFFSNFQLIDGVYKKKEWQYYNLIDKVLSKDVYYEDISLFNFLYVVIYAALISIYKLVKKKYGVIVFLLVFLFPTVTVSTKMYNYIGEGRKSSRVVTIYPLLHSIVSTSYYYVNQDSKAVLNIPFTAQEENQDKIRFYTIYQIITTMVLLPSLLLSKGNDKIS